jgi:protein-S-isoprenylcysteine O-methyltransferase Ste14
MIKNRFNDLVTLILEHDFLEIKGKFIPTLFFFLVFVGSLAGLLTYFYEKPLASLDAHSLVGLLSKFSVILFVGLFMILSLVRRKPVSKSQGLRPRVIAIGGSFIATLIPFLPRAELSSGTLLAASVVTCLGTLLSVIALGFLGKSFSLMAESRELITTGPYSVVRHPLYLFEEITIAGVVVQFFSPYALGIFVIQIWLQLQRMKYEESILEKTFPEYTDYRSRVPRLIPGIY